MAIAAGQVKILKTNGRLDSLVHFFRKCHQGSAEPLVIGRNI